MLLSLAIASSGSPGQDAAPAKPGPREFGPVVLGPDDRSVFAPAPKGFDARREGIPHGRLETVEYASKSVGTTRRMLVYTPPGYSAKRTYPVLYLLHGIGGTEREWEEHGAPETILDNLIADGGARPMIVVFPNGRAQKNDRAEGDIYAHAPAFEAFEADLLGSVLPTIETRYAVRPGAENRALAGLSMGGGQALNFGLAHPDLFAWVGGFSPAPNTRGPGSLVSGPLVPDPAGAKALRLLWLSCGSEDRLIAVSQTAHGDLKSRGVPHVWHVEPGPHSFAVWRNDLYLFAQRIFRP